MNNLRRITLATLAGGVAAGIGFKAFGHGRRHGYGPIDPADLDRHVERMLKHFYVEIEAPSWRPDSTASSRSSIRS